MNCNIFASYLLRGSRGRFFATQRTDPMIFCILTGSEDKWDYYGKVIDVDSTRVVTVMLRYYPEHSEAVEPIREWVNNFDARR